MTKHRKLLSMLLAIAMLFSMFGMLPASFVYAAGETLTAEVEGYVYGPTAYWTPGAAKSLNVSVDIPHVTAGDEYKLRIKTQRGLSLISFPYDGTKPSNVPGATVALTTGEQTSIIANSVYYDDGGTPANNDTTLYGDDYTVLTYTISGGTSHFAFSGGRIQIQTDEQGRYSYPGLDKPNAIIVELLDKTDTVVLTKTLGYKSDEPDDPLEVWATRTVGAGTTTALATISPMTFAGEAVYTIPLPNEVEEVSAVDTTAYNEILSWSWDGTAKTVTVHARWKGYDHWQQLGMNIRGKVAAGTANGTYTASGPISVVYTAFDGTVFDENDFTGTKRTVDIKVDSTVSHNTLQLASTTAFTSGYRNPDPEMMSSHSNILGEFEFAAPGNLPDAQYMTVSVNADQLKVTNVFFPIQNSTRITDIEVTLSNGEVRKYPGTTLTLHWNQAVSLYDLNLASPVPAGETIASVKANLGTFNASSARHFVRVYGWFSDAVVAGATPGDYPIPVNFNAENALGESWTRSSNLIYNAARSVRRASAQSYPESVSINSGESFTARMELAPSYHYNGTGTTFEPVFYVVELPGMRLDTTSIVMKERFDSSPLTAVDPSRIKMEQVILNDGTNDYNAWKIWGENTRLSQVRKDGRSAYSYVDIELTIDTDENIAPGTYDRSRIFFASSKDIKYMNGGGTAGGASVYSSSPDWYDFNNNGNRTELQNGASPAAVTIASAKDITVSGWLSHTATGLPKVAPYVPGSTTNVVYFRPGENVFYNIEVNNNLEKVTLDNKVRVMIPIPQATISGSTVTPVNVDGTYTHYQADDFQWPMQLLEIVHNPDNTRYSIKYYTGEITIDPVSGDVTGTSGNVYTNPNYAHEIAEGIGKVSLIEIYSNDGVSLPHDGPGGSSYSEEFQIPMTINVDQHTAEVAHLNGKMNVFRPFFWRQSANSASFFDAGYVAAELTLGHINGFVFNDVDQDGLYNLLVDGLVENITVELYDNAALTGTPAGTAVTDANGEYAFTGLAPGSYWVKFINPTPTARHFAVNAPYNITNNMYQVDSDAVAVTGHGYGVAAVTIPRSPSQASLHNRFVSAGFELPLSVTFKNSDTAKGHVTVLTANDADAPAGVAVPVWRNETLMAPTLATAPATGYAFAHWAVEGTGAVFDIGNPVTGSVTLVANWEGQPVAITLDANGGEFTGSAATLTGLTVRTDELISTVVANPAYEQPTREHYAFNGWFLDTGSTNPIDGAAMPSTATTIYAGWAKSEEQVTYVANAPAGQTVDATSLPNPLSTWETIGGTVTVAANPTCSGGYTFVGWVATGGLTGMFHDSDTFTMPGSAVTLTAQWAAPGDVTIVFDTNGGSISAGNAMNHVAVGNTVAVPTITRDGYTLNGFDSNNTAYYPNLAPGATVSGTAVAGQHVTYTAKWLAQNRQVSYQSGAAAGQTVTNLPASVNAAVGSTYTVGAAPTTDGGYTFAGYQASGGLTGTFFPGNTFTMPTTNVVLTAQWNAPGQVVFDFDGNGGILKSGQTAYHVSVGSTITLPTFERTGYTFNGFTSSKPSVYPNLSASATASAAAKANENATFKAQWTATEYAVTYVLNAPNGQTVTPASIAGSNAAYDSTVTTAAAPTATGGYTFAGWVASGALTGAFDAASTFKMPAGDVTLTAKWNAPGNVSIAFNVDGGTITNGVAVVHSVPVGSTVDPIPTVTKTGFTFGGWKSNNGKYADLGPTDTKTTAAVANENVIYTASWTASTANVTYAANAPTGQTVSDMPTQLNQTHTVGADVTIAATPPTASGGYVFDGWKATGGLTGTHQAGESFKMPATDVTLTAQWQAPADITITFEPNGGQVSGGTHTGSVVYNVAPGTALTTLPTFTREGYEFAGFNSNNATYYPNLAANATATAVATANENVIYTAQWTAKTLHVEYHSGAVSGQTVTGVPTGPVDAATGSTVTVDATLPTSTGGYTFAGYQASGGLTGTFFPGNTFTMPTTNVVLTAQWAAPGQVVFDFDGNGGILKTGQTAYHVGVGSTITLPTFERTGYTFNGFTSSKPNVYPNLSATATASAAAVANENATFTAQWTATEYVVTYVLNAPNGQTVTPPSINAVNKNYGETVTVESGLTCTGGYTFVGWVASGALTGAFEGGQTFKMPAGDVTLTAEWNAPGKVTFAFEANGGLIQSPTTSPATASPIYHVSVGANVSPVPTVTRDGFDFGGWTSNNSNYANLGPTDTATPNALPNENVIYTAVWNASTVNVTYVENTPQGATVSGMPATLVQPKTVGTDVQIEAAPSATNGYDFLGWKATGGLVGLHQAGESFTMPSSPVTFTAQWNAPNNVIVMFDTAGGNVTNGVDVAHSVAVGVPVDPIPVVTRTGYTFGGWTSDNAAHYADLGPTDTATPNAVKDENVTYTAIWTAEQYNVTYTTETVSGANITGLAAAAQHPAGATVTVEATLPTIDLAGYTFAGYQASGALTGTYQAGGTFTMPAGDVNLEAQWHAPGEVIFDFDGNGGVLDTGDTRYHVNVGDTITLPTFTRDGYDFNGWTTPNTNYVIALNDTESPAAIANEDATFTAQWVAKDYFVTYVDNAPQGVSVSGLPSPLSANETFGTTVNVAPKPSADGGYTFVGWQASGALDGIFDGGKTFTMPAGDVTLTAIWQAPGKVVFAFDGNDGVRQSGDLYYEIDVNDEVNPIPVFTKLGYTFGGWTSGNAVYPDIPAGTQNSPDAIANENVIYTAVWNATDLTVTYEDGASAAAMTVTGMPAALTQTVHIGDPITLEAAPAADGYVFLGWRATGGRTGLFKAGETFAMPGENITLTAEWEAIPTYDVTYAGGNPSGTTASNVPQGATYKLNENVTVPAAPTLSDTSYNFGGWKATGALNGLFQEGDTFPMPAGAVTLTATWSKPAPPVIIPTPVSNTCTVTFETNGGNAIDSINVESGTSFDFDRFDAVRSGYVFEGWYREASLTNAVNKVTVNASITVYAKWKKMDLNITDHVRYIYGGDTFRPNDKTTRAEAITMIYRLLTPERRDEIFTTENSYKDVDAKLWYNKAVSSMTKGGYIEGYGDGTFRGQELVSRAEFVTILVRFLGPKEGKVKFSDVPTDHWAYTYIATAVRAGLIEGYGDGTFRPDEKITRAEVVTIVNRILGRGINEHSTLGQFNNYSDNQDPLAWYYYEIIEAANDHTYTGSRPSENWTGNTITSNFVYDINYYEMP